MAGKKKNGADVPFAVQDWPATRVEMWPIDKIIDYDKNPRRHPPEQIELLAASMREDGVTMPILVDESGVIIAGHGRKAASVKNGYEQYPVVVARGWSEAKKRAARIRDNSVALLSTWDTELIRGEIADLRLHGYDPGLLGFPETQLRGWGVVLGTDGPEPDAVPETPKKPVVRRGDRWVLGDHVLVCGDATSKDDVALCVGRHKAQMIFVDPPYGVDYTGGAKQRDRLQGDELGTEIYAAALPLLKLSADDTAPLYLWYADAHAAAAAAAGYQIVAQIIWAKNHAQFVTSAHYKGKHEPCFYAHRRGKAPRWYGPNNEVTLWEANRSPKNDWHPTQKPVELAERAISNSSAPGDYVLDMFVGGGTTLIACERTNRRALAMEIEPGYVQVVIERWQLASGGLATLDGKTLEQVAQARKTGPVGRLARGAPKAKGAAKQPPLPKSQPANQRQPA